jgi:hypothetical protein
LLAHKDQALLRSIVDFFAKIIGTLEHKSAASLAAELKLPELPVDELYNARKLNGKGKSKKGTKTELIDENFDYWQQEQELLELKAKDINFELRKLTALNFPALFHILCTGLTPPVQKSENPGEQLIDSNSSSDEPDEPHSAFNVAKLRKVSLSPSSGEEEHKSPKRPKRAVMRHSHTYNFSQRDELIMQMIKAKGTEGLKFLIGYVIPIYR